MWAKRREGAVAVAVATLALILYVTTLQPDFGGPEDTPKFQFLGYVLGTAHPPGYPLYVMLSHLFVQVPIGTIAYRANLFSAVMAALACGLSYKIARALGATWWAAAGAALGLASGVSFWRSAVFAEVYSLAAVIVAASTLLWLAWGRHGGIGRLLGAAAMFAAGLGNHLTIVGTAPAAALYVVIKDRAVITPRVVAAATLIAVVGLTQYAFIIERTRRGASYLESRAESITDLVAIIRADRFAEQRFGFSASEVLAVNVPAVARVIGAEMRPLGVACFLAGLFVALRRRSVEAALVLGSAAGMFAMIANMYGDTQGFITPVVVLLWPIAALGVDAVHQRIVSRQRRSRFAVWASAAIAVALPLTGLARNYAAADQSGQTAAARFLRTTYSHLPDNAAIVAEDYFYDMAHEYFTVEAAKGPDRRVTRVGFGADEVRAAAAQGRRVFAFAGAASILAADGLWFERTTLSSESLDQWLRNLPRGTLVVGAAAFAAVPFDPSVLGHAGARGSGRAATFEAFALITGKDAAEWRRDETRASVVADRAIEALADRNGAVIIAGGQPIGHVRAGFTLAAVPPDGGSPRVLEFSPDDALRVGPREALYELKGEAACARLTKTEWRPIDAIVSTGSAVATLKELAATVVDIRLPDADVEASANHLLGDGTTSVEQHRDGADVLVAWRYARTSERRPLFRLAFSRPVGLAYARVGENSDLPTATLCSLRPWRPLVASSGAPIHLNADFESEAFFGAGWGGAERHAFGPVRRGGNGATLLLPLEAGTQYRATFALAADAPSRIDVVVEGVSAGTCQPREGPFCELVLPDKLREGISAVRLVTSGGTASSAFTFFGAWFDPITGRSP